MNLQDSISMLIALGVTLYIFYGTSTTQQDPDVHGGRYINLSEFRTDCARPCHVGESPRVCYHQFIIEAHNTDRSCEQCPHFSMERRVITVNRQLPGPAIQVCVGDVVVVDVTNKLLGEETSLHWHGMHHKGSPYMDGVPFVTQCPIHSGTSFRYVFRANAGTHFYHAHSIGQQTDGVFGPLIVRQSTGHISSQRSYDYDLLNHVIVISPWMRTAVTAHLGFSRMQIHTILINGKGGYNRKNSTNNTMPELAKFWLKSKKRYKIRVISATSLDCPVLFSIDSHKFIISAVDGSPVKLRKIAGLAIYPGERYDVLLEANQPVAAYWLRVRGYHDCEDLQQEALLLYEGACLPRMNCATSSAQNSDLSSFVPKLKSFQPSKELMGQTVAQYRVYIPFDAGPIQSAVPQTDFSYQYPNVPHYYPSYLGSRDETVRVPRMGNLSFAYPDNPLLSQHEQDAALALCSQADRGGPCSGREAAYCECVHMLRLFLNTTVDVILYHTGGENNRSQVFHLHGSSGHVLGTGLLGRKYGVEEVKALERQDRLKRNVLDPPLRDTLVVPARGYLLLRLHTNNAGYWLLESSSSQSLAVPPMAMVIRIGDRDNMPPVPAGFPRCGTYKGREFVV